MKKHLLSVTLLIAALALTSCSKATQPVSGGGNTGGGGALTADQVQVNGVLGTNLDLVDEDVWQSDALQSYDAVSGFAAVRPLRFRRVITNVDRQVTTEFGQPDSSGKPTLALVTVRRHITGSFNLLAGAADSTDTTKNVFQKPIDDQSTRRILLMRMPAREPAWRDSADRDSVRWRMVGTSFVETHTNGGSTHIVSVRVQAGPLDTTITDPLEMHRLRRIAHFMPNTPVRLTVTTTRNDDVVLFYGRDARRRFTNNGDNTYTFDLNSGIFPGVRHIGIDALSRGTLFDDTAAYDANAWMLPFSTDPRMPGGMQPVERR